MLEEIGNTLPFSTEKPSRDKTPSINDAVDYINNMEFFYLKKKLTNKDPLTNKIWTGEEFNIIEQYYKNFLYINKKYGDQVEVIVPSIEIDAFWHHHILDTRAYFLDTHNIFGYYFHHYPYFGLRSITDSTNLKKAFEVTQQLYEAEFNDRIYKIW